MPRLHLGNLFFENCKFLEGYNTMPSEIISLNFKPPLKPVMKFPAKLWKLVNTCATSAISWSRDGNSVLINKLIFEQQFLNPESNAFKTQNIKSLIRQLNLYGFKKIPRYGMRLEGDPANILGFRHQNFRRGRPEQLRFVQRRIKSKKYGNEENQESLFARVINPESTQAFPGSKGYGSAISNPSNVIKIHTRNSDVLASSLKDSSGISSNIRSLTSLSFTQHAKDARDVMILCPIQFNLNLGDLSQSGIR